MKVSPHDLGFGHDIFDLLSKAQATKGQTDEPDSSQAKLLCKKKGAREKIIHQPKWHSMFVNHVPDEVCSPPTKPPPAQWGACGAPPITGDKGVSGPTAPMGWTLVTLSTLKQ